MILYEPFYGHHVFLEKLGAVHPHGPFRKVMSLVHQKDISSLRCIRKKAPEIYVRVKDIIIITDDPVRKKGHIQAQLEGTDHMLKGVFLYPLPRKIIGSGKQLVDRIVYPVKMPLCIGAGSRIAVSLLKGAYLFFGGDDHGLEAKALLP